MAPVISLIRPAAAESISFNATSLGPPLGLAYIAGALKKAGATIQIIDAVAEGPKQYRRYYKGHLIGLPAEEVVERIAPTAKLIGISVIFTHEWPSTVQLIRSIKTKYPNVPLVLGGEHITAMPEFCLATSQADYLVLGEGEETIVALWNSINKEESPQLIPGLAFWSDHAITINPRRPRNKVIDTLARPAWDHFDLKTYHHHRYSWGVYNGRLSMPILATRGCPYQCTYCSSANMWTTQWTPRTPALVAEEISDFHRLFGAQNFIFQDLTAIIKKKWIIEFCKELLERKLNISWQLPTGTRLEAVDAEVAHLLKETGMIGMNFAPESGDEETRVLIKKKMQTPQLYKSMELAVQAQLNVSLFLVIGFPHDTSAGLRNTLTLVRDAAKIGAKDIGISFFCAYPGSQLFGSLYAQNKLRLNRRFFEHLLRGSAICTPLTFCQALNTLQLSCWKLRIYLAFYNARRVRYERIRLFSFLRLGLFGFLSSERAATKLHTVFWAFLRGNSRNLNALFCPRWLKRSEENRMFADWELIFRKIVTAKKALGLDPWENIQPTELYKLNSVAIFRREHESRWAIEWNRSARAPTQLVNQHSIKLLRKMLHKTQFHLSHARALISQL